MDLQKNRQTYAQVGVENNQVVSVYVIGSKTNTDPFEIGEKREEVEKEFRFHLNSRFKKTEMNTDFV